MAGARRQRMGGILDERRRRMLDTSEPKPWNPPACPDCGGTGTYPLRVQRMGGWWETISLKCETCLGSGIETDARTRRFLLAPTPDDGVPF